MPSLLPMITGQIPKEQALWRGSMTRGAQGRGNHWIAGLMIGLLPLWLSCAPSVPPLSPHPTALPPQAPPEVPSCASHEYPRGGRWMWNVGRWQWEAPVCVARPSHWMDGCVWERGRWTRDQGTGQYTYNEGRLACPEPATQ